MPIMNSSDQVTSNDDALSQNGIVQDAVTVDEFQEQIEENFELNPINSENDHIFEKNIIMCNECHIFFFGAPNSHKCFEPPSQEPFGNFTKIISSFHKCESCGRSFSSSGALKSHIHVVHEGRKDHKCESCGKSFYRKTELLSHNRYVHEGRRDHKCESCLKSYSKASDLKKHIRNVHEGQRDYKCESCGKEYTRASILRKHIHIVHDGRKDYKCETCDKLFSQAAGLKGHMKKHEKNYKPNRPASKDYKCDTCETEFYYEKSLKIHNRKFHEDMTLVVM